MFSILKIQINISKNYKEVSSKISNYHVPENLWQRKYKATAAECSCLSLSKILLKSSDFT